jgi:PAS domain S-box-containing protein
MGIESGECLRAPLQQVIGAPLAGFVAPELRQYLQALLSLALAAKVRGQIPFLTADGTVMWREVSLCPANPDDATGISLVATDIAIRKKAEEVRAYLGATGGSSDDAIFGRDLDGTILIWNPAEERLFGYSAGEIVGRWWPATPAPDRVDDYANVRQRISRGEANHQATDRALEDRQQIHVSLTVSPLRDPQRHMEGASPTSHDITERKLAEQQVLP